MKTMNIILPAECLVGLLTDSHYQLMSSFGVTLNNLINEVIHLSLLGPKMNTVYDTIIYPNTINLDDKIVTTQYENVYDANYNTSIIKTTKEAFIMNIKTMIHALYFCWYSYFVFIVSSLNIQTQIYINVKEYRVMYEGKSLHVTLDYDYLPF